MKPCKHCCSSGNYVDYGGYSNPAVLVPCKYCEGTGWIDENKPITVPRKYVNDDFFENNLENTNNINIFVQTIIK
jgi:hypothetical protein